MERVAISVKHGRLGGNATPREMDRDLGVSPVLYSRALLYQKTVR